MKSWDASGYLPSGLTKLAEIPAPCTSPTNANANAGISNPGTEPRSGKPGAGNERGTSAMSRSWATSSKPNTATIAEVNTIASTMPNGPSLVRSSVTMRTMVAMPMSTVGQCNCSGLNIVSTARSTRFAPSDS
jgi:hypothetical protein